jgi:anthranilate phosphoribosyltransferase
MLVMEMKEVLEQLINKHDLGSELSYEVLKSIGEGERTPEEVAAFLVAIRSKGLNAEELSGFRKAMVELSDQVVFEQQGCIDMCGTGGDGKNTFNISTCASFVVAAAGVPVTKHGNYGVSSGVGSSNVMEELGYTFTNNKAKLQKELSDFGITFLHAPLFHPAMKYVAPVRKALKIKTFFNLLGPLLNPSQPEFQLTGVYHPNILPLYASALKESTKRFAVVHADDVYDEVSLTCNAKVVDEKGESYYEPSDFGFELITQDSISGGADAKASATIFRNVLAGKGTKAQQNVVAANAGLALKVAKEVSLQDGVQWATEILQSGKAFKILEGLIALNSK